MAQRATLAAILAASLLCALSAELRASSLEEAATTITLAEKLYFTAPDGKPIQVPPGAYRVLRGEGDSLLLIASASGQSFSLGAQARPHPEKVASPVALVIPFEDERHVVLFLEGGQSLDAGGSTTPIQKRGSPWASRYQRVTSARYLDTKSTIGRVAGAQAINLVRPVAPQPKPEQEPQWTALATLDRSSLKAGVFWNAYTEPSSCLNDYVAGFHATALQLMVWGTNPFGGLAKLRFYAVKPSGEYVPDPLIAHANVYLRGDRSGTRTFRLQLGYLPEFGYNGNQGGGTLTVKTALSPAGDTLEYPQRTLGSASYPTMDGLAGRDDGVIVTDPFPVTEDFWSSNSTPYVPIDIYATPEGYHVGGEITYIKLEAIEP